MSAAATTWRLILGPGVNGLDAATGARNMAVDHALIESVQNGAPPVLRFYRWSPACLSFGRNQVACGLYDPERVRDAGIDVTRRPTGGLAVLHDRELTYSVSAPLRLFGGPRSAYATISRALVEGLRVLGVPATLAAAGSRRSPLAVSVEPCFQTAAPGEVVARGRKLIGSAQRAERGALLQHGSILLDGTQADVLHLLASDAAPDRLASASAAERGRPEPARLELPAPAGRVLAPAPEPRRQRAPASAAAGFITLRELLGTVPSWDDLVRAFVDGFDAVCGIRLAPAVLQRDEAIRAAALEAQYAAASWTWRR